MKSLQATVLIASVKTNYFYGPERTYFLTKEPFYMKPRSQSRDGFFVTTILYIYI